MYEIDATGSERAYYNVNVSNVRVIGLNFKNGNSTGAGSPDTETLALKYASMSVSHVVGNIQVTVTP
jgi:type VI protein secretion system component Hcp